MRFRCGDGNQLVAILFIASLQNRRSQKRPCDRGGTQQGLALFAVSGFGEQRWTAGFIIEQNRLEHGFHVTTHSGSVVVELLDYSINVIAARMTGHEPLDKLAANEWADVLIVED